MHKDSLQMINSKSNITSQTCVPYPECRKNTDGKQYLTHKLNRIIANSKCEIRKVKDNYEETKHYKQKHIDNEIKRAKQQVLEWKKELAYTRHMTKWLQNSDTTSSTTTALKSSLISVKGDNKPTIKNISGQWKRVAYLPPIHSETIRQTEANGQFHFQDKHIMKLNKLSLHNKGNMKGCSSTPSLISKRSKLEVLLEEINTDVVSKKRTNVNDSPIENETKDGDQTKDVECSRNPSLPSLFYEIKFLSSVESKQKKKDTFMNRNCKKNNDRLLHQYFSEQRHYKTVKNLSKSQQL